MLLPVPLWWRMSPEKYCPNTAPSTPSMNILRQCSGMLVWSFIGNFESNGETARKRCHCIFLLYQGHEVRSTY